MGVCEWGDLPPDDCPHCLGHPLTGLITCRHGNNAFACRRCSKFTRLRLRLPVHDEPTMRVRMKMQALRTSEAQYDVVLGPCPGCELWQVDYTDAVVVDYAEMSLKRNEPDAGAVDVDLSGWHEVIEGVLQEHLDECPHLRDLVGDLP